MPTATSTILDQISAEKTKISERLARLDADREKIATQLTDLETAERVLTRVGKTLPGRRPRSASAAEAKAAIAPRGRGRPPRAAGSTSAGRKPGAQKLGSGRAGSRSRDGQNPARTLRGMSQRSPKPRRDRGTAPYPRGADPGVRRQTLCDIDRNGTGTRNSLNCPAHVVRHDQGRNGPQPGDGRNALRRDVPYGHSSLLNPALRLRPPQPSLLRIRPVRASRCCHFFTSVNCFT